MPSVKSLTSKPAMTTLIMVVAGTLIAPMIANAMASAGVNLPR